MKRPGRWFAWHLISVLVVGAAPARADFSFVLGWGAPGSGVTQFSNPEGIAVDDGGWVYVADRGNDRIVKYDGYGNFVLAWGSHGSADGQFDLPRYVTIGPDGRLFVTDFNNHRVQVFDADGHFLDAWGSYGSGPGQLMGPAGITADANGLLYVTDLPTGRVEVFQPDGEFVRSFGSQPTEFDAPLGITLDVAGNLHVVDALFNRVQIYSNAGTLMGSYGSPNTGDGLFSGPFQDPSDVVVGPDGNDYVTDILHCRVAIVDEGGQVIGQVGASSPLGSPSCTMGCSGSRTPGILCHPFALAFDRSGNLFVVDNGNSRIEKFASAPTSTRALSWGTLKTIYR